LLFDLNANPERAAFPIANPGMLDPGAETIWQTQKCRTPVIDPVPRCQASVDGQGKLISSRFFLVLS
jgi:hypothetical protein